MKCDNCGKEEVNFHYTSNINGNITEKHLCAECAVKLGFDRNTGIPGLTGSSDFADDAGFTGAEDRPLTQPEGSFEDIFAELFGAKPNRRMFGGYGVMLPTFIIPTMGFVMPGPGTAPEAVQNEKRSEIRIDIDEEMKKRREVNMLREQMHQAAKTDDFEKAAAIRDNIRKIEGGEIS